MHTLSDSLFDLSIHFTFLLFISIASSTSFCSLPSLRLSRQQPCALPLRSRVARTTTSPPQLSVHQSNRRSFLHELVLLSPHLMSQLIHCSQKFDHCDLCYGNIRASKALSPSEEVSLMSLRLGSTLQTLYSSLCAIPSLMFSSAGVAPLPPGFHKLLSDTVTTLAVFFLLDVPSGVATTIACCPCHLVRVTSTFAVGTVAKFARQ